MSKITNHIWNAHGNGRAIMHLDGDAFFASCEIASRPELRGKPVVTGLERGIASSMSYEAKQSGVHRAMTIPEIKRVCPDAVILPSDYETYSLYSRRMNEIIKRYTPMVEEYSIDESFADLTGLRRVNRKSYGEIAREIKGELEDELGITFSVGVAPSKVLAKVGSRVGKPAGLCVIRPKSVEKYLADIPVGKVWGVGPNTTAYLQKFGIKTAKEFSEKSEDWITSKLTKPHHEIWRELRGESVYIVDRKKKSEYQSISKTKTFTPPSSDKEFIFAQLSKNIENACIKARRYKLFAKEIIFYLKKQSFSHYGVRVVLSHPTAIPGEIVSLARAKFNEFFDAKELYRATGVVLSKLTGDSAVQLDLFGDVLRAKEVHEMHEEIEQIANRYGKHTLFVASSMEAVNGNQHVSSRKIKPQRTVSELRFKGETLRKRVGVPYLGLVK